MLFWNEILILLLVLVILQKVYRCTLKTLHMDINYGFSIFESLHF